VRACRREAMDTAKKLQKEGDISEDGLKDAEQDIQKLTDRFVAAIDKQVDAKEAELMKI
jgi:ribosome recycling factor